MSPSNTPSIQSCDHMQAEESLRIDSVPFQDEVTVHSTKNLPTIGSASRHRRLIIDPITDPGQRKFVFRH